MGINLKVLIQSRKGLNFEFLIKKISNNNSTNLSLQDMKLNEMPNAIYWKGYLKKKKQN